MGDQSAMAGMTGHLAHQEQRYVTQLHRLPSLNGKSSHLRRIDLGDEFADTSRDLHSLFVELVLPEHAGKDGTPKSLLGRNRLCGAALVRPYLRKMTQLQNVQFCHALPPSFQALRRGTGDY